jgi:hypothetical protein
MNGNRKIILYAVAGVLISIIVVAAMFVSGIQFPGTGSPTPKIQAGTLMVLLTDAPVDLAQLNVTIDSFSILNDTDEVDLPLSGNGGKITFDLLALSNVTETISNSQVPAGNYTKMRMTVKQANATFQDGSSLILSVPPGKIDIIAHFEIKDAGTTVILIDMQADWVAISQSGNLRPVLKVKSITTTS